MSSDEPGTAHVGSPEEAFSVLGDETRLAVLLELADVANTEGPEAGLTFSELRRRVGVEDSGRFNYHLDKLQQGFVKKSGEKYVLQFPGTAIVSAVYAGTYRGSVEEQTAESRFDCRKCGRSLEISYATGQLLFQCPEHGPVLGHPVPPGAHTGRSLQELAAVTVDRQLSDLYVTLRGTCPECWGRVDIEYPVTYADAPDDSVVYGQVTCERCWLRYKFLLRAIVAAHPASLGFYADHGFDPVESLIGSHSIGHTGELKLHENGTATVTAELNGERLTMDLAGETPLVTGHRREM